MNELVLMGKGLASAYPKPQLSHQLKWVILCPTIMTDIAENQRL